MEFRSGEVDVNVYTDIGKWDGKAEGVRWKLELECREWGVKGIGIYVPDQTLTYLVDKEDSEGDLITVEKTIELTSVEIEKSTGDSEPDQIDLTELSLYKGKWTATFQF